jgi:hypothetical protein
MAKKRKSAARRPKGTKARTTQRAAARSAHPVLGRIRSLKDAVQAAIDNGASTVQEVHQRIAAMPFEQLARIAAIEGFVLRARNLHDNSIGAVYDLIRSVNARVGELADAALSRAGTADR